MSVHVDSVDSLLNQVISAGAILALVADTDGLPIMTRSSGGITVETEDALSAFASVILEIGTMITAEIQGDFQSSIFRSSDQVICASVIPADLPYILIALSDSDSAFSVISEMERLTPLVMKSMEGVVVSAEELVSPPPEIATSTPHQEAKVVIEAESIESTSVIEETAPEELSLQQRIENFFIELERQVNGCETKTELGNIFLEAKRNLTMVLGTLSAVGFHMNTFAVKAKRKGQREPLEKLKREVLVKMDHWKQLLYQQQDL